VVAICVRDVADRGTERLQNRERECFCLLSPLLSSPLISFHLFSFPFLCSALLCSVHLIVYPDPQPRVPPHLPLRRVQLPSDDLDDCADRREGRKGRVKRGGKGGDDRGRER
jgi:hypothetical protein